MMKQEYLFNTKEFLTYLSESANFLKACNGKEVEWIKLFSKHFLDIKLKLAESGNLILQTSESEREVTVKQVIEFVSNKGYLHFLAFDLAATVSTIGPKILDIFAFQTNAMSSSINIFVHEV